MDNIPFSRETLRVSAGDYMLIAMFPLSVADIQNVTAIKYPEKKIFSVPDWLDDNEFARDRGKAGWYLVRTTVIEGSLMKERSEQLKLLKPHEEIPTLRVMVYAIVGHFLATGERLFPVSGVRCSEMLAEVRVIVGGFREGGLIVAYTLDTYPDSTGFASVYTQEP